MSFEAARRIADTVLYEGLVLYPYRASSRKNRFRFQFGVLSPRAFVAAGEGERSSMTVEVPVEGGGDWIIFGKLRFLQLRRRSIERWDGERFVETDALDVSGQLLLAWDEAVEREADFNVPRDDRARPFFEWPPESSEERIYDRAGALAGRVVRRTEALQAELTVASEPAGGSVWKIRVHVENVCRNDALDRDRALRGALIGTHVLLHVGRGAFVSLLDPADAVKSAAQSCENDGAFPVLAGKHGDRSTVLGSPIILYDWPAIAPESRGDFFDATEMDEMLTLRTITLTDAEKREARATDPRAEALVTRSERVTAEEMNGLHGAVRSLRIGPAKVERGSRVRIRLGKRRTDAQDMFVDGRMATVEEVREDFEGNGWVAIVVDGDPAAEINRWYGRHLWFHADELEPLDTGA